MILMGLGGAAFATVSVGMLARYTTTSPEYCAACHAAGDTPIRGPRSLVHPSFSQVTCVDCHGQTGRVVAEGYKTGFMADPPRLNQNCIRCHGAIAQGAEPAALKSNLAEISITHKAHLERGATCTTCHANVAHDTTVPQTNRPTMEACAACHQVRNPTTCTICHTRALPPPRPPAPAVASLERGPDGRVLYLRVCSACHGPEGKRIPGAEAALASAVSRLRPEGFARLMREGKGQMPPFDRSSGGPLLREEEEAVWSFLITQPGPDVPQPQSSGPRAEAQDQGRELYQRYCGACHGEQGDRLPRADLSSPAYQQSKDDQTIAAAITIGVPGMPALGTEKGGLLSQEQVREIVAYLRSLAGGRQ